MSGSEPQRYVCLRGGLALPLEPLLLLLDLEARGFRIERDGCDLLVMPGARLTAEDRRLIRGWKPHLLALIDYKPEVIQ